MPCRLVLGARPFVDETAVAQQLAAILIFPFIRAYYAVAGTTGIVLFVRHLQFLFSLMISLAVIFALRSVLETRPAVLVGLAVVAFVPFEIHSLSYNTLGGGLFKERNERHEEDRGDVQVAGKLLAEDGGRESKQVPADARCPDRAGEIAAEQIRGPGCERRQQQRRDVVRRTGPKMTVSGEKAIASPGVVAVQARLTPLGT